MKLISTGDKVGVTYLVLYNYTQSACVKIKEGFLEEVIGAKIYRKVRINLEKGMI